MKNVATQCPGALPGPPRKLWNSANAVRWTVGVFIALAATVLFVVAVVVAPASIRANNDLCLKQVANDEHVSLEAFFQNPAQQDAFVQAITHCSR